MLHGLPHDLHVWFVYQYVVEMLSVMFRKMLLGECGCRYLVPSALRSVVIV